MVFFVQHVSSRRCASTVAVRLGGDVYPALRLYETPVFPCCLLSFKLESFQCTRHPPTLSPLPSNHHHRLCSLIHQKCMQVLHLYLFVVLCLSVDPVHLCPLAPPQPQPLIAKRSFSYMGELRVCACVVLILRLYRLVLCCLNFVLVVFMRPG